MVDYIPFTGRRLTFIPETDGLDATCVVDPSWGPSRAAGASATDHPDPSLRDGVIDQQIFNGLIPPSYTAPTVTAVAETSSPTLNVGTGSSAS